MNQITKTYIVLKRPYKQSVTYQKQTVVFPSTVQKYRKCIHILNWLQLAILFPLLSYLMFYHQLSLSLFLFFFLLPTVLILLVRWLAVGMKKLDFHITA